MIQQHPWTEDQFKEQLLALDRYYHIHHPFNQAMTKGQLKPEQIRAWVSNRYYYQINIPLKDAAILANCPEQTVRRHWIQRILDHDGQSQQEGGIEAWIQLGIACDLKREEIISGEYVLPGVRFAVDAYVNFARQSPWPEAICASLTELFAPAIHRERLANWPQHYPWVQRTGLQYFRNRLKEVPRDVDYALDFTLKYFTSYEQQQRALQILTFKLEVLWAMLDALYLAYILEQPPATVQGKICV